MTDLETFKKMLAKNQAATGYAETDYGYSVDVTFAIPVRPDGAVIVTAAFLKDSETLLDSRARAK